MENASRALVMAGGILLGILILALMVTLFASSSSLSKTYDETKNSDSIQRFNTNFTKYLGHDLTIHEVITIYNFADQNGVNIAGKPSISFTFDYEQITEDLNDANAKLTALSDYYKVEKIYQLSIVEYNTDTGYISKIKFSYPTLPKNKFKCYKKNALGNTEIVYNS